MSTLKFSHDYEKLPPQWEGTQAVLVGISYVNDVEWLTRRMPQLVKEDTKFRGEDGNYTFDFKECILLTFYHLNTGRFFTTIRRYTEDKYDYYEHSLLFTFNLERMVKRNV